LLEGCPISILSLFFTRGDFTKKKTNAKKIAIIPERKKKNLQ
jgi:hypothetical protein